MSRRLALLTMVCLPLLTLAQESSPAPSSEEIRALLRRIEELEQKVKALEAGKTPTVADLSETTNSPGRVEQLERQMQDLRQKQQADQDLAEKRAREMPRLSIGERGFAFTSADTNFNIQLRGLLQIDAHTFFGDSGISGNDTLLLRRARPIIQGTVYRDFDFLFAPDFGGPASPFISDAYINYRLIPEVQVQGGKFKVPVGLELLQSDPQTYFTERGLPTALVPSRDMGFKLHGDLWDGAVSYDLGIFNGIGDLRTSPNLDIEDNKALVARVFFQPFKANTNSVFAKLGFGVGGSWEDLSHSNVSALPLNLGGALPGYSTPGQEQFFAYNPNNGLVYAADVHYRLAPQGYWYYGPFGVLAEYTISDQGVIRSAPNPRTANLHHTAWQVSLGYVLTGEDAGFNGVVPRRPFRPLEGQWGAVQVVARYSELDIDDAAFPYFSNPGTSARGAQEFAFGVNWYLNRNIRVNAHFSHVHFRGAGTLSLTSPGAVSVNDENVLLTRFQLYF